MGERITIPGTNILYTNESSYAFSVISPLIRATGGFSLSQICAITGLEGSTVQNWVKRGYVGGTLKSKRYNEKQVARILIFNALRGSLQLEEIARLMEYVNGVALDPSDDIIEEGELFSYICMASRELSSTGSAALPSVVETVIKRVTKDYKGSVEQHKQLRRALTIMSTACYAVQLTRAAQLAIAELPK